MSRVYEVVYQDLCVAAHRAYTRGIQTGSGGNLSARLPDGSGMVVKSSGGSFIDCTTGGDGFVETDFLGNVISGSKKPTREVFLHGLLYRLMPDAGSIVHTHSPWAVTWSYGHDELPRKTYHSELKIKHRIPVLHIPSPIVRPEDEPVIHTMLEKIPNISAFLLEGHGVVALGKTAKEAEHLAELIEETSQIVVCATLLNKLRT